MQPGKCNSIIDVEGFLVGNAEDHVIKTGVTVLMAESPFPASVSVMGGAPGTRETDLLMPGSLVEEVDALFLAGGSAYGLDAATGIGGELRAMGRGYKVGKARVPIVPGAILFDLLNGGKLDWQDSLYPELGRQAVRNASREFRPGTHGAGTGATTMNLKGGLGTASAVTRNGYTVGALVAVNAVGSAVHPETGKFWAGCHEFGNEYGGMGAPARMDPGWEPVLPMAEAVTGTNTTIGIIATDVALDKAELARLALVTHDGYARALFPSHTILDGDLVFAASSSRIEPEDRIAAQLELGHCAAQCMARAIARAVYCAVPADGDRVSTWHMQFGVDGP